MRDGSMQMFMCLWKVDKSNIFIQPNSMVFRNWRYRTCNCSSCCQQWKDHSPFEVQVSASLNFQISTCSFFFFSQNFCREHFSLLHLCGFFVTAGTEILKDWSRIKYLFGITCFQLETVMANFSSPLPGTQCEGVVEKKCCQVVVYLSRQREEWQIK